MSGLYYLPLGGAAEIGMNMYLYGYGPKDNIRWIMVDCGIGFPDAAHAPGVDTMTVDPSFIADQREQLDAILITHAHEDHIGAVGWLWDKLQAPVYCTAFPAEIARRKMEEAGQDSGIIQECEINTPFEVGAFTASFFPMTHSVPETSAIILRSPLGTVFHTADFKIDDNPIIGQPMDKAAMKALGEEGLLAVVCDSTNVFEEGVAGAERDIAEPLKEVIAGCSGKVAATTFASNVARLKSLAEAAKASDRAIVVAGRAMRRMLETAIKTGTLTNFPEITPEKEAENIPDEHLFYLATGSQGEGRAAMARIAGGNHPVVTLNEGDTAIYSSKTIPGNEVDVARVYNMLAERGIEVIDSDDAAIHVSGHACRDELAEVYALLKPEISVPMHGELRHLREHARLARDVWGIGETAVVSNGEMLRLAPGTPEIVDDVPTGRLYRDGDLVVGAMDGVVRERRKMAMNGHIAISVILDEQGDLVVETDVRTTGAPAEAESGPSMEERIADAVDDAIESMSDSDRKNDEMVEEKAAQIARRAAHRMWGKKPETVVFLTRLEE